MAFIDGAEGLALMALLDDVLPNAMVCYVLRRLFSSVVLLTLVAGWFETIWPYLSLIGVLMSFFIATSSLVSSPRFS